MRTTFGALAVTALAALMGTGCFVRFAGDVPPSEAIHHPAKPGAEPSGAVQRAFARGPKPPGALMRAREHRDAMLAHKAASSGGLQPKGINTNSWTLLGPPHAGGRIRSILIHPVLDNAMLVGAATGGVWRTLNDGQSWVPSDDFMASLTIGCMAMDPITPTTVYAGTGEGFFQSAPGSSNSAAIRGEGIFKSIDFGVNWFLLASTGANPDFQFVNEISIAPSTGVRPILAATGTGIFRSIDGGTTWAQVHAVAAFDVKFHPTDGQRAVAAEAYGNALYSSDAGLTWHAAVGGPSDVHRIELAWAKGTPGKVYAASHEEDGNLDALYVSVSDDFGESYVRVTNQPDLDSFGEYAMALWVDPLDDQNLLLAATYIYRSTDGGVSFSEIAAGHADHHVLIEHPHYGQAGNRKVFNGSDGGIYRYDDPLAAALTITDLNESLVITQFYGADIHPSGRIVGGTQDNGSWTFDPQANQWSSIHDADGGFAAIEPSDPDILYYESQGLTVYRSDDGGVNEAQIFPNDDVNETGSNFIAPLERDPDPNDDRLYRGGRSLWRSTNATANPPDWTLLKETICGGPAPGPAGTESHTLVPSLCNISTIAVSPLNPARVWVGYNNGQVWNTANGNSDNVAWTQWDDLAALPDRWCSDIVADPFDEDVAYVSFMGYATNSVFRTNDFGLTWINITGAGLNALPELPVNGLAAHPMLPGVLYAATDLGIYESEDYGVTWSADNVGPSNVSVDELVFKDVKRMMAVTHGRGLWIVDTFDDCNGNMIPDTTDIMSGFSKDLNFNGIPDECETGVPPGKLDPTTAPIKLGKTGGDVVIHCSASCSTGAQAYGIYEGTIGSWYSHKAVAGLCASTCPGDIHVSPSVDAAYYLVVPNTRGIEGSYGTALSAAEVQTERPRAPLAADRCAEAQMIAPCP